MSALYVSISNYWEFFMVKKTHFGHKVVDESEKQSLVDQVFNKSASHYDLMNDLMSAGIHRLWKDEAINFLQLQPDHIVCDVAAGSGDLTKKILSKIDQGQVYMTDININMLNIGYDRILDECINSNKTVPLIANGENLPFKNKAFDRIICGFGIRNMTNLAKALSESYRCLVPGGRLVILEFAKVADGPLSNIYDFYLSNFIPKFGEIVARDKDSYQYLVESIKNHPDQSTFAELMRSAGFSDVSWKNLSFGAVAIHVGVKI